MATLAWPCGGPRASFFGATVGLSSSKSAQRFRLGPPVRRCLCLTGLLPLGASAFGGLRPSRPFGRTCSRAFVDETNEKFVCKHEIKSLE
jgi:hypothetical protein